jgi:hypothetical protein
MAMTMSTMETTMNTDQRAAHSSEPSMAHKAPTARTESTRSLSSMALWCTAAAMIVLLTACSPNDDNSTATAEPATPLHDNGDTGANDIVEAPMIVFMTPWCGCCKVWADQSVAAGFEIEIREVEALHPIKEELGVPPAMGSCHTAKIANYFIEGHVPFDSIRQLLTERPEARGLTVPGMPIGSPGMEQDDYRQAFDVFLIELDGEARVYNHYPEIRP